MVYECSEEEDLSLHNSNRYSDFDLNKENITPSKMTGVTEHKVKSSSQESSTLFSPMVPRNNCDYIPDSLKDFITKADAAIDQLTFLGSPPTSQNQTYTNNTNHTGNHITFQSPPSDIKGPFDTDMGSQCRPNPVDFYNTESAVKQIAMNESPNVCPDHGDSCTCHLKLRVDDNTMVGTKLDDVLCQESSNENDDSNDNEERPQVFTVLSTVDEGSENIIIDEEMKEEEQGIVYDEDSSLPIRDSDNDHHDIIIGNHNDVHTDISDQNNDVAIDGTDDIDEEIFLPTCSQRCDAIETKMQSNVPSTRPKSPNETSHTKLESIGKVKPKRKVVSSIEKRRVTTVPKSPPLNNKLRGTRRNSSNITRFEKNNVEKKSLPVKTQKRSITLPKRSKLHTSEKLGERRYSSVSSWDNEIVTKETLASSTTRSRRQSTTISKGPKLRTLELHGKRHYSAVGLRDETKEYSAINHDSNDIDYKTKTLTVPRAPTLLSTTKYGERKYSGIGLRIDKEKEDVLPDVDYKTKPLTIPKAPKLISSTKLGERRYSAVGSREEKLEEVVQFNKVDYKTKRPTVPRAPKLASSAKLGERKYSVVGGNHEESKEVPTTYVEIDYKHKPLTKPKPFHFLTDGRMRRETPSNEHEIPKKVFRARPAPDFSRPVLAVRSPNRLLTKSKASNFKSAKLVSSSSRNENYNPIKPFRARPLPDFSRPGGSLSPTKSRSSRSITVPKPFSLSTSNRSQKEDTNQSKLNPKEGRRKTINNIAPLTTKRTTTTLKPFRLSTSNITSRNQENLEDCPYSFRRKLLARSARSEQTKDVMTKVETLSALMQEAMVY